MNINFFYVLQLDTLPVLNQGAFQAVYVSATGLKKDQYHLLI